MATGASPPLIAGTEPRHHDRRRRPPASPCEAGDTLQTFADRINGTDDVGVSASVVNDKLVLISRESGSAGAITPRRHRRRRPRLRHHPARPGRRRDDQRPRRDQLGQHASQGAINGVTLNLGEGRRDHGHGRRRQRGARSTHGRRTFVDAYNAVMKNVKLATSYDAATKTAGTLQGDQTMSGLAGQLRNIAGSAVTGLGGGAYDSLAQIGHHPLARRHADARQGRLHRGAHRRPGRRAQTSSARTTGSPGRGAGRRHRPPAPGLHQHLLHRDPRPRASPASPTSLGRMDDKITSLEALMDLREQTPQGAVRGDGHGRRAVPGPGHRPRVPARRTRLTPRPHCHRHPTPAPRRAHTLLTELRQYTNHSAQTATPGQLVVMLYDGFLRFAAPGQGRDGAGRPRRGRPAADPRPGHRHRAARLPGHDPGRRSPQNLASIYEYVGERLTAARLHARPRARSPRPCAAWPTCASAWAQIASTPRPGQHPPGPSVGVNLAG